MIRMTVTESNSTQEKMTQKNAMQIGSGLLKWKVWILLAVAFLVSSSTLIHPQNAFAESSETGQFGPSSYIPLLRNNSCSGTRPEENPMGVQLYGTTGASRDDFVFLQNTQTSWIRVSIGWQKIEPTNETPAQYNWSSADRAMRAAVENCANLIVTIDETTDWATINNYRSPIKTEHLDDFRDFVAAAVERYDGDGIDDSPTGAVVNYWEFYNEPDFGNEVPGHEGWGEHGARYAEMLATVYDTVHAANPNANVVFGGVAHNLFAFEGGGGLFIRGFIDEVFAAGGAEYFDIMNFHYYPFEYNRGSWTETNASGLREKLQIIQGKLESVGAGDKPVILSEIGWHSKALTANSQYPSTEEYQARRVVELMTQAKALDFMAIIWWAFGDLGGAFAYETGLLTPNSPPSPKPSYLAYLQMVQRVGTATLDANIALPTMENDLEAYRFRKTGTNEKFYVAWLNPVMPFHIDYVPTFDEGATQPLQVEGEVAQVFSKTGVLQQTLRDADDGADDGKISVNVGRSPIFIEID